MVSVVLPCDYEEWLDYQKIFILLSHLRSVKDLNLFISSHTRREDVPTPISRCLEALKGLMAFLTDFCTPEEQKKFLTSTLPFIARSASQLEERVPLSGIPFLSEQENSALVLGRKVILSILANAFLCTFTDLPEKSGEFSFKTFFDVFLSKDADKKKRQADKLRCILCYFECAAADKCNLSAVLTYRRQVLAKELPLIAEWQNSSVFLCPFEVDQDNTVEDSGGHTLQVCCAAGPLLGGGVLAEGCGREEIRYLICPELLLVRLVMADMESNEAVLVTGAERFSCYSGCGPTFKFAGQHKDESECDVFGNFLNSLLALDSCPPGAATLPSSSPPPPPPPAGPSLQPEAMLNLLNKSYVGFFCQQDRGDISTELLALTVKRGSLAFVAEDYPEYGAPLNVTSRQSDLGNVHLNIGGSDFSDHAGPPLPLKLPSSASSSSSSSNVPPPQLILDPPGGPSSPLSPIPEISESPNFPNFLAMDIIESSLQHLHGKVYRRTWKNPEDEMASKMASSLIEDAAEEVVRLETPPPPAPSLPAPSQSVDDLASALSASIMRNGVAFSETTPTAGGGDGCVVEARSNSLARAIISDVLTSPDILPPVSHVLAPPQTQGEASDAPPTSSFGAPHRGGGGGGGGGLTSMALELSGSILSDAVRKCTATLSPDGATERAVVHRPQSPSSAAASVGGGHPAIYVETERRGSLESGRSSRSSSLTGQTFTVHEFVSELADETVREGISIARYTVQGLQGQAAREEEEEEEEERGERGGKATGMSLDMLADGLVAGSIQDGLLQARGPNEPAVQGATSGAKGEGPDTKKQPPSPSRQGLSLGAGGLATTARPASQDQAPSEQTPEGGNVALGGSGASHNLNSRLLTPVSSRTAYAWSIASTRDEDSRPVSPTDLNKIGLSLSSDTDEFSSLFSSIVINNAICNVTGESLSPHTISEEEGKDGQPSSLQSSSKIGIFLSKLGEAEPPPPTTTTTDVGTSWQKMRRQLLRPVATGGWGAGQGKEEGENGDWLQVTAMIQWMAASASGRPRLFYYGCGGEDMDKLGQVTSLLRSKFCTVGQLCHSLMTFARQPPKGRGGCDLYTFLLQKHS